MLSIDTSDMPGDSAAALVARSSATQPDDLLADRPQPRFVTARWHRRQARLDGPVQINEHVLSYCERGGAVSTVVIDGALRRVRQHAGAVCFLPAGCHQRWLLESPCEVVHTHLYISADAMREALGGADAALPRLQVLMDVRHPWFDSFFRLFRAELEACRASGRLQDLDLLDRVGPLLVRRLVALQHPAGASRPARVAPMRPALLQRLRLHVDAHLARRIPLEELAAIAAMSPDHLVRSFEQATGVTPHHWILQRRLEAACQRLRCGTERIEAVARACGFAGAAHFSATFRRHHGVTPTAYRRAGRMPARRWNSRSAD